MDEAIIEYLKKTYNLMVGERTSEEIKIKIGSAYPLEEEMSLEVKGRDLVTGLPKSVTITSEEVREALQEPLRAIVEITKISLERTPPELAADLIEHGIVMAGGGSLLKGLDKLVSEETGLPVHIADDPLTAVAQGTGKVLNEIRYLKKVTVSVKTDIRG
jgi:rod shape-determining protein MreB